MDRDTLKIKRMSVYVFYENETNEFSIKDLSE